MYSRGCASRGVRAAEVEPDSAVQGMAVSLFQLQLAPGKKGELGIVPLTSGKISRDVLQSSGVYLVDTGFQAFLWVGLSASFEYRVSAFNFAQCYLKKFQRPSVLPLSREAEGSETQKFWSFFEPPVGYRIDVHKDPARYHPAMRSAAPAADKKKRKKPPPLAPQATWVGAGAKSNPSAVAHIIERKAS